MRLESGSDGFREVPETPREGKNPFSQERQPVGFGQENPEELSSPSKTEQASDDRGRMQAEIEARQREKQRRYDEDPMRRHYRNEGFEGNAVSDYTLEVKTNLGRTEERHFPSYEDVQDYVWRNLDTLKAEDREDVLEGTFIAKINWTPASDKWAEEHLPSPEDGATYLKHEEEFAQYMERNMDLRVRESDKRAMFDIRNGFLQYGPDIESEVGGRGELMKVMETLAERAHYLEPEKRIEADLASRCLEGIAEQFRSGEPDFRSIDSALAGAVSQDLERRVRAALNDASLSGEKKLEIAEYFVGLRNKADVAQKTNGSQRTQETLNQFGEVNKLLEREFREAEKPIVASGSEAEDVSFAQKFEGALAEYFTGRYFAEEGRADTQEVLRRFQEVYPDSQAFTARMEELADTFHTTFQEIRRRRPDIPLEAQLTGASNRAVREIALTNEEKRVLPEENLQKYLARFLRVLYQAGVNTKR